MGTRHFGRRIRGVFVFGDAIFWIFGEERDGRMGAKRLGSRVAVGSGHGVGEDGKWLNMGRNGIGNGGHSPSPRTKSMVQDTEIVRPS